MLIGFRSDSGSIIGSGHIYRCLYLIRKLLKDYPNIQIIFYTKPLKGNCISKIRESGFPIQVELLNSFDEGYILKRDERTWFGNTRFEELELVKCRLRTRPVFNIFFIDHYATNSLFEEGVMTYCKKLVVIDDLAKYPHNCDTYINGNYFGNTSKLQLPKLCEIYTGIDGLIINPSVFSICKSSYQETSKNGILVYFGGAGLEYTKKVVDMLVDGYKITVIGNIDMEHKNLKVVKECSNIGELYSKHKLAIGAGGISLWERCYVGLPSIVLQTASNQGSQINYLKSKGCIELITSIEDIPSAVKEIEPEVININCKYLFRKNLTFLE